MLPVPLFMTSLTKNQISKPRLKAVKKTTAKEVIPKTGKVPIKSLNIEAPNRKYPLGHLLLAKLLKEENFAGDISTNSDLLNEYSTDESIFSIRPQLVIQPKNQRDVEIAVQVTNKLKKDFPSISLTPRAAGTGLSGGSLTDSIIIDVSRHMHHKGEPIKNKDGVTITVEPGAMWKDVESILKKHGVYLPSYPASKDFCSIGGSVANNAAGPDSLQYGQCAKWVNSLNVTLYDGKTYTLKPITYKEYKSLTEKDNALATILKKTFAIIEKNEKSIQEAKPKVKKNSSGYALWGVLNGSVASFKRGKAVFDLTQLISGSQGTIGIITSITLRTTPINPETKLIVVPVFDLMEAGKVISKALDFYPNNIEFFDDLTFDLALRNPSFFKIRLNQNQYYKVILSMYTLYHVRYARKIPDITLLITIDPSRLGNRKIKSIIKSLQKNGGKRARLVKNPAEQEMFWQIRRSSYSLSKLQDSSKRPAAFLEDMTVPPENISKFLVQIKKLLHKYNVPATVHGHGGDGHFHFYPLLDFTNKTTPLLVEKMAEEFFSLAKKFGGNICGEHNDGIIRTPYMSKMFTKKIIDLFEKTERTFDPLDIFNPGKKVNPRFDIKSSIRKTN